MPLHLKRRPTQNPLADLGMSAPACFEPETNLNRDDYVAMAAKGWTPSCGNCSRFGDCFFVTSWQTKELVAI